MIEGVLIDPVTDESVPARIPTWFKRNKNIYHIPNSFKIEDRFYEQKHTVFIFKTKDDARYFEGNFVAQKEAKKFDRFYVKEINALEFAQKMEEGNVKTDNSDSRKKGIR